MMGHVEDEVLIIYLFPSKSALRRKQRFGSRLAKASRLVQEPEQVPPFAVGPGSVDPR
jgi:hypothetical protein